MWALRHLSHRLQSPISLLAHVKLSAPKCVLSIYINKSSFALIIPHQDFYCVRDDRHILKYSKSRNGNSARARIELGTAGSKCACGTHVATAAGKTRYYPTKPCIKIKLQVSCLNCQNLYKYFLFLNKLRVLQTR